MNYNPVYYTLVENDVEFATAFAFEIKLETFFYHSIILGIFIKSFEVSFADWKFNSLL